MKHHESYPAFHIDGNFHAKTFLKDVFWKLPFPRKEGRKEGRKERRKEGRKENKKKDKVAEELLVKDYLQIESPTLTSLEILDWMKK